MRTPGFSRVALALLLCAIPLAAAAQQQTTLAQVVDKIVAQEQAEVQSLRQYSPIVETYIQMLRPTKGRGAVPNGDKYFLGRADLAKGVELEPLISGTRTKHNLFAGLGNIFSMEFLPRGFLQMIYLDMNGFDRQHYKFSYVGREFLGDIRCLVFDVDPSSKPDKGRFVGRIWVEDQDYHIVRFNGGYSGGSQTSYYFNFDSWRTNAGRTNGSPLSSTAKRWTARLSRHSRPRRAFGATLPTRTGRARAEQSPGRDAGTREGPDGNRQ